MAPDSRHVVIRFRISGSTVYWRGVLAKRKFQAISWFRFRGFGGSIWEVFQKEKIAKTATMVV
jgi:hypothetical protein